MHGIAIVVHVVVASVVVRKVYLGNLDHGHGEQATNDDAATYLLRSKKEIHLKGTI